MEQDAGRHHEHLINQLWNTLWICLINWMGLALYIYRNFRISHVGLH